MTEPPESVYLVWHNDYPESTYLVGVCRTRERAKRMLSEDARANEIQEWELDRADGDGGIWHREVEDGADPRTI